MILKTAFILFLISLIFTSCDLSIDDLLNNAHILYKDKKYVEAIKIYDEVISKNSKIQLAYYNRGHCYFKLKNYPKAYRDFDNVINLRTYKGFIITYKPIQPFADEVTRGQVPYYEALYERAQVKFFMDSTKSAFIDFQICVDNNYEASNSKLWQGTLWVKGGNKDKACEFFRKAKQLAKTQDDVEEANEMIKTYCTQ